MTHPLTLLIYFLLYFAIGFAWRSWWVYRRTGMRPVVLPATDDAHGYVGRAFKLVMLGLAAQVLAINLTPGAELGLAFAPVASVWLGWALLTLALGVLFKAQHDLGTAWRIGLDAAATPDLVQHGLYAHSRNPIFLAMRLSLLGLWLISPGAVSLALACVGEVLMQVQVRLEEAYLHQRLGANYARYRAQVRRWV